MINLILTLIAIVLWVVIYMTKPYYHTRSKLWTCIWEYIFMFIGCWVGFFGAQFIVYLSGGTTVLNF